jgi:hypothetical protein
MATPEIVGHIDPVCTVVLGQTAIRGIDSGRQTLRPVGVDGRWPRSRFCSVT